MRVRTVTVVAGIRSIYRPIRNLLCNVAPRRYAAIVVHNLEYLGDSITLTVYCKSVSLKYEHRRFECLFVVAFNILLVTIQSFVASTPRILNIQYYSPFILYKVVYNIIFYSVQRPGSALLLIDAET